MSPRSTRRRRIAATLAISALSLGVSAPAGAQDGDISHRSRYSHAVYTSDLRSTRVEVAVGWNDPAGGAIEKSLEVEVTQKWCSGKTLVTRELSGSTDRYLGKTNPRYSYSTALANLRLTGTRTSTPAGAGCTKPEASRTTSRAVSIDAVVLTDVRGRGERLSYTQEDGGSYTYQESSASGALFLAEWEGWFGFTREAAEPGETWLWEGFWADARGVDVASLLPD